MTGVSIKAVTFPVFPVFLFVLITALTESLPRGLFHFPSQPVRTTQSPPPPPPSSLSLSLSFHFSFFHILTSPDWSLFLPGFSFCPPPPNSSTDHSLLHSRQTRHFLCALSLLSHHLSLSLSLTHLCSSLSHIISLFTHSGTPTARHMLFSYSYSMHAPSKHILYIFQGQYHYSFYCFIYTYHSHWPVFKCRLYRGKCNYNIFFFQWITLSFRQSKVRLRWKMHRSDIFKLFV